MLIKFATGIRVIVTTANFVEYDTIGKSQGVWYQDFPRRQAEACEFEVRGLSTGNAAAFGSETVVDGYNNTTDISIYRGWFPASVPFPRYRRVSPSSVCLLEHVL